MKGKFIYIFIICLTALLFYMPLPTNALDIADYTAYPPFVTNAIEPNILLVLDESGSMQFPAYTGCDFSGYSRSRAQCGTSDSIQDPEYSYDLTNDYYGYFKSDKYYEYSTNKFVENVSCSFTESDPDVFTCGASLVLLEIKLSSASI